MKRDMELVRKILLKIEETCKKNQSTEVDLKIDGYELNTVAIECKNLYSMGLIESYEDRKMQAFMVVKLYIGCLTRDGQDYLKSIKI